MAERFAQQRKLPASERPTISAAALLVKVMAAMARPVKPASSRCSSLAVLARVLPAPAPTPGGSPVPGLPAT